MDSEVIYMVLALAYLTAVGWYLINVMASSPEKRAKREKTRQTKESGERHRGRKEGKRCPQCDKVIDVRRDVCQHCGHEFPPEDRALKGEDRASKGEDRASKGRRKSSRKDVDLLDEDPRPKDEED